MPFEPLKTDIPNPNPKKRTSWEVKLFGGCVLNGVLGVLVLAAAGAPFSGLVATNAELRTAYLIAAGLSLVLVVPLVRLFGLSASSGAIGGAMAAGVYQNIRMRNVILEQGAIATEYREEWQVLGPILYAVFVIVVVLAVFPYKNLQERVEEAD